MDDKNKSQDYKEAPFHKYTDSRHSESVLRDLRKAIRWRKSEINDLQKTFDAHALEDVSTKQRCMWQNGVS